MIVCSAHNPREECRREMHATQGKEQSLAQEGRRAWTCHFLVNLWRTRVHPPANQPVRCR